MSTEPTGRSFISYRRSRSSEAAALVAAHREHGIPTWQDVDDLPFGVTEEELRRALQDPLTANGVLWLTPEVTESDMIRRVEAPLLIDRVAAGDSFFVVPVAAGGLDYEKAAGTVADFLPAHSLEAWNLMKAEGDLVAAASLVTRRVLTARIQAIHASIASGQALEISVHTRGRAPFQRGTTLAFDWSHRIDGRLARPKVWSEVLIPAARTAAEVIRVHAPGRAVIARGLASVPAAIVLGEAFLSLREVRLTWMQFTQGRDEQPWSLSAAPESSGLSATPRGSDVAATDLAVLVSVTNDVRTAFQATQSALPPWRAIVDVHGDRHRPVDLESPGQAVHAARLIASAVREGRHEYQPVGVIHLFMAVPPGLAVMVGQLLNTLGPVQTYEYLAPDGSGRYQPAARLTPTR